MVAVHPQRRALNDEVHSRPNVAVPAPARIISFTVLHHDDINAQRDALARLLSAWQCPAAPAQSNQYVASVGAITLRWALHTEFVRYTVLRRERALEFDASLWQLLPENWLADLPGELLVAMQLLVLNDEGETTSALADRHRWFQEETWVGAELALGTGLAVTDLRLYPEPGVTGGVSRMVLVNHAMSPGQTGRMVQRLFEIESYRMLALLALPIAKHQMGEIDGIRRQLNQITNSLLDGGDDRALLQQLSLLSAQAEALIGDSQYRFSAARAYHALVARRIEELREGRMEGVQPFSEFLHRRLVPALETCDTVSQRQERLNARLQRATTLLRTRVEVTHEEQNQQLLSSMNRRAELQLRLQQTVESLSVVVLTYYFTGLLGYALKGVSAAGVHLPIELITGASVPVILLGVLIVSRRFHRRLTQ